MPSEKQNILDKKTRDEIYSLSGYSFLEAQTYLAAFYETVQYKQLMTAKKSQVCDEDIICMALARKVSDLHKVDMIKLKNAIFDVCAEKYSLDYDVFVNDDFYGLCMAIGNAESQDIAMKGLKAAVFILVAMNYATKVFSYGPSRSHQDCTRLFLTMFRGVMDKGLMRYNNLSGLSFEKLDLDMVNLSDVDLTDVNLSFAQLSNTILDRAFLKGAYFHKAEIRTISMRGALFDPEQFSHVDLSYYSFLLLTPKFDEQSLVSQLNFLALQGLDPHKHAVIFKSLVVEIEAALKEMNITIEEKKRLLKVAIHHPLFGDKKANTVANWFNSIVSAVSIGENKNEPTIALSASQSYLYATQFMLGKFPGLFQPGPKLFNVPNNEKTIGPIEAFLKTHGSCYGILNVARDATSDEIQKQFRLMSLQCHPDKNNSPEAVLQFEKISEARDILTNVSKRLIHDQLAPVGPAVKLSMVV